ncbi:hypothetical protein O9G_002755 [Rozella allomycis CSF55]|uniref:DUF2423 domain-containing protein n=1 Tax=Rozella allomycis (strain CSF55) TaxID=988480 RepID=A0A075B163_ROZAC|nr:hypothetical protein O9G_002755 [Rozella allomycis CSF55]|eukprot:EPZ34691.1 hypothetical protein O9G_002755 [Rozella allomycis CSF55]
MAKSIRSKRQKSFRTTKRNGFFKQVEEERLKKCIEADSVALPVPTEDTEMSVQPEIKDQEMKDKTTNDTKKSSLKNKKKSKKSKKKPQLLF